VRSRNRRRADHPRVSDHTDLLDARARAQTLDDRGEPCHIGGVAGPQERGKWPITAAKYHSQDDLLAMRPIVFATPSTLEIQ